MGKYISPDAPQTLLAYHTSYIWDELTHERTLSLEPAHVRQKTPPLVPYPKYPTINHCLDHSLATSFTSLANFPFLVLYFGPTNWKHLSHDVQHPLITYLRIPNNPSSSFTQSATLIRLLLPFLTSFLFVATSSHRYSSHETYLHSSVFSLSSCPSPSTPDRFTLTLPTVCHHANCPSIDCFDQMTIQVLTSLESSHHYS